MPTPASPFRPRPPDVLLFAGLVLGLAMVYFATFTGVTSSNDGSHYALVRAIVDHRQFEIGDYLSFTENQDYAVADGRYFSDRPPGTALWASPWFALATRLPIAREMPPSKHDAGNPNLMGIGFATALAGALAVGVFWRLLREFLGLGLMASTFAALALGLGSMHWKYSSVLYSHSLAALTVLGALFLALWLVRWQQLPVRVGFVFGLVLGYSAITEYTNALLVLGLGGFVAIALWQSTLNGLRHPETRRDWLLGWGAVVLGGLLPLLFLAFYNQVNFGSVFTLSRTQVDLERWPENENLLTSFSTPLWLGLRGMLVYSPENGNQGLFLLAPVALLGLPGLYWAWQQKQQRREWGLLFVVFIGFLVLFSLSTTYNPYTNDGRYLTPFLALWWAFVGAWVEWGYRPLKSDFARLVGGLLTFGLLTLSVRNALMHIAFSWGYDLKSADLLNASTPLPNLQAIIATVFPNFGNLWWLLLVGLPWLAFWWWWVHREPSNG